MPIENGKIYGKFKKILISEMELKQESIILKDKLIELEKNKSNTFTFADQFFQIFLESRLKLKNKKISKTIYGIPSFIFESLNHWENGSWNFELIFHVPSSFEMLEIQTSGKRFVSIDFESAVNGSLVENKRDAFEHFLHDLAHGYHFFKDKDEFEKQVVFFKELKNNFSIYKTYFWDEEFKTKFDYCLSDMNSNSTHLKEYLKAILIEHYKKNLNITGKLDAKLEQEIFDLVG